MTVAEVFSAVPSLLGTRDRLVEDKFSADQGKGNGMGMIQACYVYCPLSFFHYYIISTLDHQALDPRGSGPLLYVVKENWPSADNDWCPVLCLYCFELPF